MQISHLSSKSWTAKTGQFNIRSSNISSTENDGEMLQVKAFNAVDMLLVIIKSDISDRIKDNFLQAGTVSLILWRYSKWKLIRKHREKPRLERQKKVPFWKISFCKALYHLSHNQVLYNCGRFFYIIIFRWLYLIIQFGLT